MNSKNIIVGNMKMYLATASEVDHWLENFSKAKKELKPESTEAVLCPSAIFIEKFIKQNKNKNIHIGAQNCIWENKGAFTGEISPSMLASIGVKFVILGHSERRKYFGEDNDTVSAKAVVALKAGVKPIICVGEDAEHRRKGMTMEVVLEQLDGCLAEIGKGRIEDVIICYEPVWAISANNPDHPPTTDEIMSARLIIKKYLVKKYGEKTAERVRIIYGGSVDSKNVEETCVDSGMNGALIGKTSSMPYDFVKIINIMDKKPC